MSVSPNATALRWHLLPTAFVLALYPPIYPSPMTPLPESNPPTLLQWPPPTLPKPHQEEDVGPGRTEPLRPRTLPALQLHPHGVQQPLSVGNLMGPHDVEECRAQGVERLALVRDLWAQGV